jgi:hypothetical protein
MFRYALLCGALAASLVCGCSKTMPPNKSVVPVAGRVTTSGGEPVRWAYVELEPKDPVTGSYAHGTTDGDGTLKLRTYSNTEYDGVVPGAYEVSIHSYDPTNVGPLPASAPAPTKLAETVKVEVEVQEGSRLDLKVP